MDRLTEPSESTDPARGPVLRLLRRGRRARVGTRLLSTGALMLAIVAVVGWLVSRDHRAQVSAVRPVGSVPGPRSASSPGPRSHRRAPTGIVPSSLSWRILASRTTRRIVNAYLPPMTARGIYLIMDVVATNGTRGAVTLKNDQIALDIGGSAYRLDSGALSSLELAGHKALSGTTLRPDATVEGWVVFDVPQTAATATPRLCLGTRAADRPAPSAGCPA